MHGIIGKLIAADNKRDELIEILIAGSKDMPGCLSYVVAKDGTDENALWISEIWDTRENHEAALALESVQQAIAAGKPLISGFGERFETTPVGGHGLPL
jgi:quinol monooxygenase YgiN